MGQLSPNQNDKLRQLIVRQRMEKKWSISEMARQLGIKQGSLSQSLGRGGGFSYATALAFCEKFYGESDITKVLGKREVDPLPEPATARQKAASAATDAPFDADVIADVMASLSGPEFDGKPMDFFYQRIRDEHFTRLQAMAQASPLGKKPRAPKKPEPRAEVPAAPARHGRKRSVNE